MVTVFHKSLENGKVFVEKLKRFLPKGSVATELIGTEGARLLREQHVSEDPLGKIDAHPKS
ncbi:hypothetical protein JOD43_001499 [Pullulanibacillus pueri]|nr:hypothetical protein [Pullulanibacillus pueri]